MRIMRCLLLVALSATPAFAQSADTVLTNGKIVTLGDGGHRGRRSPSPTARSSRPASRTRSCGLAGPATRRIDLGGRTVIPGLINSHMHAIRAALFYATEVNWIGSKSIPEAMERGSRESEVSAKPGEWIIVAGGWTPAQFAEKRRPTQAELVAAAPDNPVYIQLFYSNVLLTPAGFAALGHHQGRRGGAVRGTLGARRRAAKPERLDRGRQPDHLRPVRQAAAADLRRRASPARSSSSASSIASD